MEILNAELQTLIQLQELDLKIVQLQERTRQIPLEINQLDKTLEETRSSVAETGRRTEDETRERRRLEGDVELLRQKLSKYRSQLMEVKTNKEYQAMLHEIANVEKEIQAKEDQILERMLDIDEWEEKVSHAKKQLKEEEKIASSRRKELETSASQSESEAAQLQEERAGLLKLIPNDLLQQYHKLASARRGVALAEARDQSCQACHVKLRPQLFNEIKTNRFIITCESCNRILYYPGP